MGGFQRPVRGCGRSLRAADSHFLRALNRTQDQTRRDSLKITPNGRRFPDRNLGSVADPMQDLPADFLWTAEYAQHEPRRRLRQITTGLYRPADHTAGNISNPIVQGSALGAAVFDGDRNSRIHRRLDDNVCFVDGHNDLLAYCFNCFRVHAIHFRFLISNAVQAGTEFALEW